MKKTLLYTLFGLLALTSCIKDEDPIQPSGNYSVLRFDFPQGNNPYDQEIVEIHDQYGIYVIYKDITDQDINRQWQSLGTGKPLTCDEIPEEDRQFYVDFLKDQVLSFVTPEFVKLALPVKVYLIENLRNLDGSSDDGSGTGGLQDNSVVKVKLDGFDYWALSLSRDENGEIPRDNATLRFGRCKFIYTMIQAAYEAGVIEENMEIRSKLDTTTALLCGRTNRFSPNYTRTRGYADNVSDRDFSENDYLFISMIINGNSAYRVEYDYFMNYCRLAMYYGREYVENKYASYPLVLEIYNDVVEYMLSKYGVDLESIYEGPVSE